MRASVESVMVEHKRPSFITTIAHKIVDLSALLLGISVSIMLVLVTVRYFFRYSFPWAEETTRYLIVYAALLTGSVITRERGHVKVGYFRDKLPENVGLVVRLISDFLVLISMSVLIFVGFDTALFMRGAWSGGVGITMFWPYLAIPISAVFFTIAKTLNIIDAVKKYFRTAGR